MGRINNLLGVANNLATSFVSVTNLGFLRHIEDLPVEKTKLFEIDLLKETIKPGDLMSKSVEKTIKRYKKWFILEINKFKIDIKDIEKVTVKTSYKPGKSFARYYTCNVTIRARDKDYIKKVMSSFC